VPVPEGALQMSPKRAQLRLASWATKARKGDETCARVGLDYLVDD
jgi:hypothetical protein